MSGVKSAAGENSGGYEMDRGNEEIVASVMTTIESSSNGAAFNAKVSV